MRAEIPAPGHESRHDLAAEANAAQFRSDDDVVETHESALRHAESPGHMLIVEVEGSEDRLLTDAGDDLNENRVVSLVAAVGLRGLTHPTRGDLRLEDDRRIDGAFLRDPLGEDLGRFDREKAPLVEKLVDARPLEGRQPEGRSHVLGQEMVYHVVEEALVEARAWDEGRSRVGALGITL